MIDRPYIIKCRKCSHSFRSSNPRRQKHIKCRTKTAKRYPKIFYSRRHAVLARDQHICQCCKIDKKTESQGISLAVHHIDGNRRNNKLENLVSICMPCLIGLHRKYTKKELVEFSKKNFKPPKYKEPVFEMQEKREPLLFSGITLDRN